MRFTVFLCVLIVCALPLSNARRKLKSDVDASQESAANAEPEQPIVAQTIPPLDADCSIVIERSVEDNGYHRELVTRVFLSERKFTWCVHNNPNTKLRGNAVCNIHIEENLPSSVYIDPYEMKTREPQFNVRAYPRSKIDLELPSELAEPVTVDMFAADIWPKHHQGHPIYLDYTMRMPFHVRYHAPADNATTHHTVEIPPPGRVAVKCVRTRLRAPGDASERYHLQWPHGVNIMKPKSVEILNPLSQERFFNDKTFIELQGIPEEPIKLEVPVGDGRHKFFVSPITGLVSVSAVAIILIGIFKARQRMANDANLRKAVEASLQEANAKKEN